MARFNNWPQRLIAYIEARERRPFAWGKNAQDCCSFANGAVIEMTGQDAMADIPDYETAEEADLILATPLADLLDARFPRRPIGLARRGDIAMAELDGQDTLMIVEGATLVGPGRRGLVRLARSAMRAAWAI
ncbi:MAG: hypothetical protein AB7O04_06250 [Hyphomonadaceae bacterium]